MKPRAFSIKGDENTQTAIRNNCVKFIDEANLEHGEIDVIVQLHEETRRGRQNRLMWLWNGQIGQEVGVSPDYAHGMSKLDIGLPYMLTEDALHARASFLHDVLSQVVSRKHKIMVAYDMIRTKDLKVRQFADYLNRVEMHYAAQGIVLVSPDDLRMDALGKQYARAA